MTTTQQSVTVSTRQDKVLKSSRRYAGRHEQTGADLDCYVPNAILAALGNPPAGKRITITFTVEG